MAYQKVRLITRWNAIANQTMKRSRSLPPRPGVPVPNRSSLPPTAKKASRETAKFPPVPICHGIGGRVHSIRLMLSLVDKATNRSPSAGMGSTRPVRRSGRSAAWNAFSTTSTHRASGTQSSSTMATTPVRAARTPAF